MLYALKKSNIIQIKVVTVLGVAPEEIISTELLPTYLRKQYQDDKLGILDVRIRLNGGTQMDMEIQVVPFELWAERSLFYLSKMYTDQIHVCTLINWRYIF